VRRASHASEIGPATPERWSLHGPAGTNTNHCCPVDSLAPPELTPRNAFAPCRLAPLSTHTRARSRIGNKNYAVMGLGKAVQSWAACRQYKASPTTKSLSGITQQIGLCNGSTDCSNPFGMSMLGAFVSIEGVSNCFRRLIRDDFKPLHKGLRPRAIRASPFSKLPRR